jgi:hypothetical protein
MKINMHFGSEFYGVLSSLLVLASSSMDARAAEINENFNDAALPSSLEIVGPSVALANGGVLFPATTGDDRTYLRTVNGDFYGKDFVAEVTVVTDSIAWFGMGDGSRNPAFYMEPSIPSINLRMHPSWLVGGRVDAGDNVQDPYGNLNTFGYPGSGTHRLRLTWDSTSKTAVFEVHQNYTGGPFVATLTSGAVGGADNGFTAANCHVFFGGAGGIQFDDFRVTYAGGTQPDTSLANASLDTLWPPNHKMVKVSVLGVVSADSDVVITVTGVMQDEPTDGLGDGDEPVDATINADGTVWLRAERSGKWNGRVYHIYFTATDSQGSASGEVTVSVPRDKKGVAIDDGDLFFFDSTL